MFAEAFSAVHERYVDHRNPRFLALAALRGLEQSAPSRMVRIVEDTRGVVLISAGEESADESPTVKLLEVSANASAQDAIQDLQLAASFVRRRTGMSPDDIASALVKGMMTVDPEGAYLDVATYREMHETAPHGGIGLELTIQDGQLTVVSPIGGAPAERAGLRRFDRIVRIDGESTDGMQLSDAVRLLRGRPSSVVVLSVLREEWAEPRDIEIAREAIRWPPLVSRELSERIGYVRVRQFQDIVSAEFDEALAKLTGAGITALVLDLRGNSGGLLTSAIEVAEKFRKDGQLVAYTEGRIRNQNMRFTAHAKRRYTDTPMVVLIDHGSAGASEIVAGAFQDWGRATLVGEPTFGRSSLQTIVPLRDGSALRLTTARWFTPKGRSVQGTGLRPDVDIRSNPADDTTLADPARDAQLWRALELVATVVPR